MARILVIEDDPQIIKLIRKMLGKEGYEVEGAPDGQIGINLFREKPYDLVITDILMPGKEGITTIIELRRDFPTVKIIAISGGGKIGSGDYLALAQKIGVPDTLPKPFSDIELIEMVRKHLPDS